MDWSRSPGFAPLAAGLAALANLALARALLAADNARVYIAGRAIAIQCAFKQATGLPCPTCGLTRSVVMSLHGEWARAWQMAPAGPVAVAGLTLFALAMALLGLAQICGARRLALAASGWIRRGALAYSAAGTVVWLAGWVLRLHVAR